MEGFGRDVEYVGRRGGQTFAGKMHLEWEVYCDPVSDDYDASDDPRQIWNEWRRRYPHDKRAEARYGPGAFSIYWAVATDAAHFESAPGSELEGSQGDDGWLVHYTWPRDAKTGEDVSLMSLPVRDKLWVPGNAAKGGFIQQLTGWKPSPLQEFVNVPRLEQLARLA